MPVPQAWTRGPDDAGPSYLDLQRDPGPLTPEEAACLGVDAAPCASCHVLDGANYRFPYWAPADPVVRDGSAAAMCGVRSNRLSPAAAECFGLDVPACADCHTTDDGSVYLRPWNGVPTPPDVVSPTECYDL